MSYTTDELVRGAETVGTALAAVGASVVTVESCTGGWVGQCLTGVDGASAWYERGFVAYSNRSKIELLGVDPGLIDQHGAVSNAVVLAMVNGGLERSHADYGIAISGISGPGGGYPDKPVGTVYFCWKARNGDSICERVVFSGDRQGVRRQTVVHALKGLLRAIERGG